MVTKEKAVKGTKAMVATSAVMAVEEKDPLPPLLAQKFDQRAIQSMRQSEKFEQQGEKAFTAGRDNAAQNMMSMAERFEAKAGRQAETAQRLRLPYTDVPLVPKAVVAQANKSMWDTPVKVADQAAPMPEIPPPMPETTPTPSTASLTAPAAVPTTLPLTPPPLLLPPRPPMMMGPPMGYGPGPQMPGPPMLGPGPARPFMGGRISPANAAAATAALAASYFLFF